MCTFLKAQGVGVGKSKGEGDRRENAKAILEKAEKLGVDLLLPSDHVVAVMLEETPTQNATREPP